jgi:DUF4097 and DUF4098 domain-containing protein YvlB
LIKAISGDLKINMPTQTNFTIKGVSGDIKISQLNSTVEIASVSGDIVGRELSGSFAGDFISGDVDLEFQKLHKVKIKSKSGNITLRLDESVKAALDIETKKGHITCDFELQNEKKEMNKLTGVINMAEGAVEIRSEQGDISIEKRT